MSQSHSSLHCSLLRALSLNAERSTNDSVQDERERLCRSRSRSNYYTEIEGILQLETWDCGVACLLMIKRWLQEKHSNDDNNLNNDETLNLSNRSHVLSNIRTESIWTSDLMWQLHLWNRKKKTSICTINPPSLTPAVTATSPSFDFDFVLVSQQLMDVDETYRDLDFYQDYFEEDQCRVAHTFRQLYKQQVPMVQTTTTTKKKSSKADTDERLLSRRIKTHSLHLPPFCIIIMTIIMIMIALVVMIMAMIMVMATAMVMMMMMMIPTTKINNM